MPFCRVIDVVAVDQTTVLLTEDGSVYVCGRWNDEDITTPKRKERNGRDLFAKGLNVTTGGCVRLGEVICIALCDVRGPLLLTWFNFNPIMYKQPRAY